MGYKNAGFSDFKLNPIGFRSSGISVPYLSDALHYSNNVVGTTRPDRTTVEYLVTRCDVAGTADAEGAYFILADDYLPVQNADLTDTLVDDHTLLAPTNQVVEVASLNFQTGNQIYVKVDSGVLTKLLIYDREMTLEERAVIILYLGTGEYATDSAINLAIDSAGDLAVAPKAEYYVGG